MRHHGPKHEQVDLTAYERRQLELITEALANDEPPEPRDADDEHGHEQEPDDEEDSDEEDSDENGEGTGNASPLWIMPMIAVAWISVVVGVAFGVILLVVLGVASTTGAIALYLNRRRPDTRSR